MKKRLCLFLIFAMVLGLFSTGTMATGADTVYLSVSYDGQYGTDKNGKPMAYVPVSMAELSAIDLAEYGLGDFLYDAGGDGSYDTTALHLYIYAHETLMGLSWDNVRVSGSPGSIYFEDGLFGYTCNMQYYLNGDYPQVDGWGLTVDQIALSPGDFLDVAAFTSWSFFSDSGFGFHYFLDNGAITHAYAATAGETCKVGLGRAASFMGGGNTLTEIANYTVSYGATLGVATGTATTNSRGQADITFPAAGTYYLWASGTYGVENPMDIVSAPGCAVVTVEAAPEPVSYTVSLPEGEGFMVNAADGSASPVAEGGSYSFTVTIADGYQKGEDFAVKANDVVLTEADGVYTLTEISENQQISVCGVEIIPTPEPEPEPTPTPQPTPTPTPTPEPEPTVSWREVMANTEDYLTMLAQAQAPSVGSTGGEWLVLGVVRNGMPANTGFLTSYYETAKAYVQTNIDANGRLHASKSTDNSRLILALTALGKDVTNVGGHNLLRGLSDTSYVKKQGINGPIWALIALDSRNYDVPANSDAAKQVTRQWLIDEILKAQLPDGGWKIMGDTADDMTAMAVQALAPYYRNDMAVKAAVDRALVAMEQLQNTGSPETCAQIIVARSALGLDSMGAMEKMLVFAQGDGSFRKDLNSGANQMSTEQAFYAMVAYNRFLSGGTSLYDMRDVMLDEIPAIPETTTTEKENAEEETVTAVFTDVAESDYYYDAVCWAVAQNITAGTGETTFSPNGVCTRAQMVTFLWRAAGCPDAVADSNFADADPEAYWYKAMLWAVEQGITTGTTETTFSPDVACTRGQMAAFLYRSAKSPAFSAESRFGDVADDAYYGDAVKWAAEQGITTGTTETTFSPDGVCTRAQMVTFLYRYFGK